MHGYRKFRQIGSGVVQVHLTENGSDNVLSHQLIYREVRRLISKKTILFQGSREGLIFSTGV